MKKDEIKKELNNIFSNKKIKDAVVVVLVLAFLLVLVSIFTDNNKNSAKATDGSALIEEKSEEVETSKVQNQKYEDKQRSDLKTMLENMEGVGKVDVMIHFESGEVKVPAIDNNKQASVTEEKDSNGGNRVSNQETDGSKVVMKTEDGNNEPVILQTNNPTITGILITAEGAESSKIKYDIQVAVSSLYGISLDKVNVYPMKS